MSRVCFLLLFQLLRFAAAQAPSLSFRNININEGLSQSSVIDIAVDTKGFIWFATQDGLNRFDGKDFVVYNKIFDDITTATGNRLGKIVPGRNNDLWLLTAGGKLEHFDLANSRFTLLSLLGNRNTALPPLTSLAMNQKGDLLLGTDNEGLFIFTPFSKKLLHFSADPGSNLQLPENHIQQVFTDSKENNWVLGYNTVSRIDSSFSSKNNIPINKPVRCSVLDEDLQGNLWLGTFGSGLYIKRTDADSFIAFTGFSPTEALPADLIIESLRSDGPDKIWLGTYGKGLYLLDKKRKTVEHFVENKRTAFSLDNNDILSITRDVNGSLWIGTDGGGVSYYNSALNNFSTYSNVNLPAGIAIQQVRSIAIDAAQNIWAGTTNQGMVHIDPAHGLYTQMHFNFPAGTQERIVSLQMDEEGDMWIGTQGNGLLIVDTRTRRQKQWFYPGALNAHALPDPTIWCMLPVAANKMLVGTQQAGLIIIDKKDGFQISDQLPLSQVPALEKNIRTLSRMNDSIVIVGYERKGVQLLNLRTGQLQNIAGESFKKFWNDETVLKCHYYSSPYLFTGTLGKGLLIVNVFTGEMFHLTEKDGLPNNTIYGILPDASQDLWMSSNRGLFRLSWPMKPQSISRSSFTLFSVEDGLQSNEFNTGAHFAAPDGRLFFGGVNGLNFFDPSKFTTASQMMPVALTQLSINNEPYAGDSSITYSRKLVLPYNENALSFNFAALNFLANTRLNYSYRLRGYNSSWTEAGNRNYAAYTNLKPGNYVFEVRAFNPSRNQYGPTTNLSIHIVPPWWRSWWFITLFILAILALLYALYRNRVNQLLRLQQVRSRIATDLHDDIGSTLTNINILSELSKKNLAERGEAETFLNRITEEVNSSSQALDDIVWSINKDNDTIQQTIARMRRYAAEIFEGANIGYSLRAEEDGLDRKLKMELRRDLYLLFKEIVNNIYKHSRAKYVDIHVWKDKGFLHITIADDGIGFDATQETHRNGIKNMYVRVSKWRGSLRIDSRPGEGTTTALTLSVL